MAENKINVLGIQNWSKKTEILSIREKEQGNSRNAAKEEQV